jgi:hypothetical protein
MTLEIPIQTNDPHSELGRRNTDEIVSHIINDDDEWWSNFLEPIGGFEVLDDETPTRILA